MNIQKFLIGSVVLFVFSSCKSLKTLASKDNSTTQQSIKPRSKNIAFIDNIEVTPGSVVTSKHKTINTAKQVKNKKQQKESLQTVEQAPPNESLTKVNIENVDGLQLKYAILLDATVERLNNVLMLQTIEKWYGTRYRLGGTTLSGVDCSGFTIAVAKAVYGLDLSRTAQEQ